MRAITLFRLLPLIAATFASMLLHQATAEIPPNTVQVLVYGDDFSSSNAVWSSNFIETHGNQQATNASYVKIENGALMLKANVDCGWDYLGAVASLHVPLPPDYVITYRARKTQYCGTFRTEISASSHLSSWYAFPCYEISAQGSWFGNFVVWDSSGIPVLNIPPATSPFSYGSEWHAFEIKKQGDTVFAYADGALQWSGATDIIPAGGFLHFYTAQAGATAEIDDLKIYQTVNDPSILQNPVPLSVLVGDDAVFSATAVGTAPLSFQWYRDGTALDSATDSTLIVTNSQLSDSGLYSVKVQNVYGQASSTPALLRVVADTFELGMVAYYPIHGNAIDESGNGNDAVAVGALLVPNRFGVASECYALANGAYLQTTGSEGFPAAFDDFAVSLWLNFSAPFSPTGAGVQMIFANGALNQFQLALNPTSEDEGFMDFWTGGDHGAPPDCRTATIVWNANQWYNLVVVRSANNVTVYRDGCIIGASSTSFGNNAGDRNLFFGYRVTPQACCPLFAKLDDIRIYARALSLPEVLELCAFESPECIPHPATATAELLNGRVVRIQVQESGCSYTKAPLVKIEGGGGKGATAIAEVAYGRVTSIVVTRSGTGYSSVPTVSIADPTPPKGRGPK